MEFDTRPLGNGDLGAIAASAPPTRDALREARVAISRGELRRPVVFRHRRISSAHPGFWAPFVLLGRP